MGSGVAYTIIKPGGLLSTDGGKSLLLAGHNDDLKHARQVSPIGNATLCGSWNEWIFNFPRPMLLGFNSICMLGSL